MARVGSFGDMVSWVGKGQGKMGKKRKYGLISFGGGYLLFIDANAI